MLRDYLDTSDWSLVEEAVEAFIPLPPHLMLVGFGDITPDSFVWKLYDSASMYYLYAEDYVESLDHVRSILLQLADPGSALEFLPAKNPLAFEDSLPNRAANIHKPPEDEYDFIYYAAQSGHDFVFLAKSNEKLGG